jgi:hypothetical protein
MELKQAINILNRLTEAKGDLDWAETLVCECGDKLSPQEGYIIREVMIGIIAARNGIEKLMGMYPYVKESESES